MVGLCQKLVAMPVWVSLLTFLTGPFMQADDKKTAFDAAAEKVVRQAVYDQPPTVEPVPQKDSQGRTVNVPITILVVPKPLAELYKRHPRPVLELLLRIMDGANPRESSLAAGYAMELLGGPGRGLVCVEFFNKDTYDAVDKDWEKTPRQHWMKKVREKMAAKKLAP
jgi:hypothetical protein